MGVQSDHESGYFEGDDVVDDDDLEIIHEEIVNPGSLITKRGLYNISTFLKFPFTDSNSQLFKI